MLRYLYFLSMLFIVTVTSPQIRIIKNSPSYCGLYILRKMILFFILPFHIKLVVCIEFLYILFLTLQMERGSVEAQMLKYINLARQFPAYYISLIDKQLATFVNEKEMPICEDVIYETNEGKSVWKEARKYLEKQSTLPPFQVHEGLNMSAKDHAVDLAQHGIFGHTGSDKSTFSQRILRYCRKGQGAMAEIIGADFLIKDRNNPQMTVLGLIIDDGVSDRGHRKTIFNPEYRYIGCKSEIENDKLITVFNLTQNKLEIRGRSSTITNQSLIYGSSTAPCFKKDSTLQKVDNNGRTDLNFNAQVGKKATERTAFEQVGKNVSQIKSVQAKEKQRPSKSDTRGKRITQKKQNTRIWHEQGCKITEKVTQIYYIDGTMQENIEKHTVYS